MYAKYEICGPFIKTKYGWRIPKYEKSVYPPPLWSVYKLNTGGGAAKYGEITASTPLAHSPTLTQHDTTLLSPMPRV